jgi:NADH dehydrogenase
LSDFVHGEVSGVDLDNQTVSYRNLRAQDHSVSDLETLSYDHLVVALGSDTAYYGVPGAEEYSIPLKSLKDAKRIKNQMIRSFEEAQLLSDDQEKRRKLKFVIVGGGPTGVELAGEMADLVNRELADSYPDLSKFSQVTIIDGGDKLIKQMGDWFGNKAQSILEKKGVHVRLNTRVHEVQPAGVSVGKQFIFAGMIIWAAGVKAQKLNIYSQKDVEIEERTDRIKVNNYLQIPLYENVYVVGDQAHVCDSENNQPYPMRAQFAVREGKNAANNITQSILGNPLKSFSFSDKGFILSIGKGGALAKFYGFNLKGLFAWFIYRSAYLFKMLGIRVKIRTVIEWTLNYFTPRDISEL